MRSTAAKTFYFNADAHALGGYTETPVHTVIPLQASVSLPAVGGHGLKRGGPFDFEQIVSCRSTYTRVAGVRVRPDGASTTQVTAVVEGLNILEVITADRVVSQISVDHPIDGSLPRISFTGSTFENLKIGGFEASLVLNPGLTECGRTGSPRGPITYPTFQQTGRQQAGKLIEGIELDESDDKLRWLIERYRWMAAEQHGSRDGVTLCSLVDSVEPDIPGRSFGHVIDIRDFGRVFLAEVIAFPSSVQLTMVRAELGCATSGGVSAAASRINGTMVPP